MTVSLTRNLALAAAAAAFAGGASAANLVNYWSFEGGFGDSVGSGGGTAGAEVSTGTGHDGNTAAVFPQAVTGGGAYDSTGYVDTSGVTMSGAFAFSWWFNISDNGSTDARGMFDFSSDAPISATGADGPQALYIQNGANDGSLAFRMDGESGSGGAAFAAGPWDDGNWHFAVANYDPITGITLHVDGSTVDGSTAGFGDANWEADQYLGAFNVNTQVNRGLDGSLDDVAIYSGNLTAGEIDGLFSGQLAPTDIPEPGSLALLGLGGLAMLRRRRA